MGNVWGDIKQTFVDIKWEVVGVIELLAGGAGVVYSGVGLAGANNVLASIPVIAILGGSAIVVLDGLENTGIWKWQENYQIGWYDIFKGYGLGAVEMGGGLWLLWKGANTLWDSSVAFNQYKGPGYLLGVLSAGAGGYLAYDGYKRITGDHGTLWELVTKDNSSPLAPENKWQEVSWKYKYTFGSDAFTDYGASIEQNRDRCKKDAGKYIWDEEAYKCFTKSSYQTYRDSLKLGTNERDTAHEAASNETQDGTKIPSFVNNPAFWNKKVGDFTCQDWILYNTPYYYQNTDLDETTALGTTTRLNTIFFENSAPQECIDAARKGKKLDAIVPNARNTQAYLRDRGFDSDDLEKTLPELLKMERPESSLATRDVKKDRSTRDVTPFSNIANRGKQNTFKSDMQKYASKGRRVTAGKKSNI